jgi:hypothetical protein
MAAGYNKQGGFTMRRFILACLLAAGVVNAEEDLPWNRFSAELRFGSVAWAAILDDRGPYSGGTMDAGFETGFSFRSRLGPRVWLDTVISMMKVNDRMQSSGSSNFLDIGLDTDTLWLTVVHSPGSIGSVSVLDPWYGIGIHAGVLKEVARESFLVSGSGYFRRDGLVTSSAFGGVQAVAGVDVYPHRSSALCLTFNARLHLSAAGSDFEGVMFSPSLFAGIKWDFGQNPE